LEGVEVDRQRRFFVALYALVAWREAFNYDACHAVAHERGPGAFYWLNLWGEDHYRHLREVLINHSWRLPKRSPICSTG
jgi:hypothetical protein